MQNQVLVCHVTVCVKHSCKIKKILRKTIFVVLAVRDVGNERRKPAIA